MKRKISLLFLVLCFSSCVYPGDGLSLQDKYGKVCNAIHLYYQKEMDKMRKQCEIVMAKDKKRFEAVKKKLSKGEYDKFISWQEPRNSCAYNSDFSKNEYAFCMDYFRVKTEGGL